MPSWRLAEAVESGQVEKLGDVGVLVMPIGTVNSVKASVEAAPSFGAEHCGAYGLSRTGLSRV